MRWGDLEHWAMTPSQHNKLVNSVYKYKTRDKHPDPHNGRDGTLGTQTSSLFRTRRSVDINSDVGDTVMKRMGR